jgi:two-component sensor histidine kinase
MGGGWIIQATIGLPAMILEASPRSEELCLANFLKRRPMSTPTITPRLVEPFRSAKRQLYTAGIAVVLAITPFVIWPRLSGRLLSTDFLPHAYCYLRNPGLVWTHVVADSLIGISYFAISITMAYLVYQGRRELPFRGLLMAYGLFIVACGATHLVEVLTIWVPVYVLSAAVKIVTAMVSVVTAVVLPFTVPQTLALVQQAKASAQVTAELRASEERKEALLQEVHHRVKNNLAVICSLFYLQSTHTKDKETIQIFRDMERRVHSMALVHENLSGSENVGRIDFAEYARDLANDIISSHAGADIPVQLKTKLERVIMSVDSAVPCGLILNELISNALKHAFPDGVGGQITVILHNGPEGECSLCVEDSGVGIPAALDVNTSKSMGMRLVRSLTRQLRGSFELMKGDRGTTARLHFTVDHHEC